MRIAIVGKGGSGKTTLSTLFSLYLDTAGKRVGLLDVDVNSHTAEVLGHDKKSIRELSAPSALDTISQYLAGDNPRVKSNEFLNTTPPGRGSGRWTLDNDNVITQEFGLGFGQRSHVFTLGSYSGSSIGADCHHTTQHIAENLLSHALLTPNDVIVVDSVAGNDTFANSLYLQDILLFVLKPEREGLSVFERYLDMALQAGIEERVYVIGNQANSDAEKNFLKKHIPASKLLGILETDQTIVEERLEDKPLSPDNVSPELSLVFSRIVEKLSSQSRSPAEYHNEIVDLHRRVASQDWVSGAYRSGLSDQIDSEYTAK